MGLGADGGYYYTHVTMGELIDDWDIHFYFHVEIHHDNCENQPNAEMITRLETMLRDVTGYFELEQIEVRILCTLSTCGFYVSLIFCGIGGALERHS